MADPVISCPTYRSLFVIDLSGQNSNPMIPDSFISNHLKGKNQSMKMKLTSDASVKIWEVELDGGRFAGGWKDFSVHHCVRNDDVLSFRHEGDMVFHVTPFGRSFSQIQFISSTSDDEEEDDDDDVPNIFDDEEEEENVDVRDDDNNSASEEDLHSKKFSSKKIARKETESSSDKSHLVAHVTPASLRRDSMCLTSQFARSNGLDWRRCEIDLMNEHEISSTLLLRHNGTTGQAFMRGGWRSFCRRNEIKAGSFCRFKLVQRGTKPVLQLCPNTSSSIPQGNSSKANQKRNVSESEGDDEIEPLDCSEIASMNQNRIVTLDYKPYMIRSSQLRLPASFTRENGIVEAGEITVVNKDGVEWKSHLVSIKGRGQFYIRGWRDFFEANDLKKVGDSFTLEVIRGGTSPILKICSKIKEAPCDGYKTLERRPRGTVQASHDEEEIVTRVQKRGRVSAEGGPSRRTRASNNSSDYHGNLHKQPLQPCSISDQVKKVKQSIVDTLTSVRRFQSELEIKEHNLEASLQEIDALGEKIVGISKIFNFN
ncbi:putative B3 domain-containing protein REM4 [Cardamine amara subsp. amara]|uniref:B3 domain-containing protein REM4 n=1 Tax=Cardamine amara subsp. amara TaxID=228776 RepID=A0ABD1AV21_CARAN